MWPPSGYAHPSAGDLQLSECPWHFFDDDMSNMYSDDPFDTCRATSLSDERWLWVVGERERREESGEGSPFYYMYYCSLQ